MAHTILTFVTHVEPQRVDELRGLLNEIGSDIPGNRYIPFGSITPLHFASLVLHQDPDYGARLIFESNFDGPLETYLADLYEHAAEALHRIYGCCLDYAAVSAADRAQLLSYLNAHVVRPNAYHIGNVGRTLERTRQENVLRDDLESYLDDFIMKEPVGASPISIRERIQTFVRSQPALAWALHGQPRQTAAELLVPWFKVVVAALIALALLPVLIPLLIAWVIVLRRHETHDPVVPNLGDQDHARELVKREDRTHIVQNHLASITLVKPGKFRLGTLKGVLWLINLLARAIFTHGKLSGIPSIHFAHWSLIDDGKRLLFLSNFDGSWENYLDDFIDKAAFGLTAIWTNTAGFPSTKFLFKDGARDGARFKAFARDSQAYTNVWYSAYPDLTVQTIDNNTAIRSDLFTSLDETAARAWLWRF